MLLDYPRAVENLKTIYAPFTTSVKVKYHLEFKIFYNFDAGPGWIISALSGSDI